MADAKELEKEAKAEEREMRAIERGKRKIFDEHDESFCGFMSLSLIDSDGYAKKTKGCEIKGPLYMVSEGNSDGPVVIESEFALNPLFYLQVPNEDGLLIWGQWWLGEKASPLTTICSAIPKLCQAAHKEMEKSSSSEFTLDAEAPLLKGAPGKLYKVTITTREQKFITKVVKVTLEIPRSHWVEWKNHRLRFWQFNKNSSGAAAPSGGGGGDEKEEKDSEKKEE
jgi:hypothetical protein